MLMDKTKHSIFSPELVLSDLLPNDFPAWKRETETESVTWLVKSMRHFFVATKRRGCIVNADNQLLHQHEMDDAKQLSRWSCNVIKTAANSAGAHPRRFVELCVPVLYDIAFRGDQAMLESFLCCLTRDFDQALSHVEVPSGLWVRKSDVVRGLQVYEKGHIARNARCTAIRALSHHPILFGGMVYACAFALAYLRLRWMERRTRLLVSIGVIPTFR